MLFIVCAVGLSGGFVLGLDGLMVGSAGELERIAAIACFAMAAAGLLGMFADDGRRAMRPRRDRDQRGDVLRVIAVAPILALSVGVFVATLLPAIYVMLPVFAVWGLMATPAQGRAVRVRGGEWRCSRASAGRTSKDSTRG